MTREHWRKEFTALTLRAARLPDSKHPTVRTLHRKIDALIEQGFHNGYITTREAETL